MTIVSFRNLEVWKKAYALTLDLYQASGSFPRDERFRLSDQLVRSAMSIPSNLAEGFGRRTSRDKAHFYTVASGSTEELTCWLLMAQDLGFLARDSGFLTRAEEVGRMLNSLIRATLARDS